MCTLCHSQYDPANDEEEREGHSNAKTNVNAKENGRSKGHQPDHLRVYVCAISHECVCECRCVDV